MQAPQPPNPDHSNVPPSDSHPFRQFILSNINLVNKTAKTTLPPQETPSLSIRERLWTEQNEKALRNQLTAMAYTLMKVITFMR